MVASTEKAGSAEQQDSAKPRELAKSPNWDALVDSSGFIEEGFPFHEGFPDTGPFEFRQFMILTRIGERLPACVDFSTQYRAEGLRWRLESGETLGRHIVAAWCEVAQEA